MKHIIEIRDEIVECARKESEGNDEKWEAMRAIAHGTPLGTCKTCNHNHGLKHYGDFNPNDIVCDLWSSDGFASYDFCSRWEMKEKMSVKSEENLTLKIFIEGLLFEGQVMSCKTMKDIMEAALYMDENAKVSLNPYTMEKQNKAGTFMTVEIEQPNGHISQYIWANYEKVEEE